MAKGSRTDMSKNQRIRKFVEDVETVAKRIEKPDITIKEYKSYSRGNDSLTDYSTIKYYYRWEKIKEESNYLEKG